MKIQWGIACGPESHRFVSYLIESVLKTISKENSVQFILGINATSQPDILRKTIQQYHPKVDIIFHEHTQKQRAASQYHGFSLDNVYQQMNTSIGIVSDCDIVIMRKDWDLILLKELSKNKKALLGTEYGERKAAVYNKDGSHNFPVNNQKVPCPFFCIFKVDVLRSINFSFMPHRNTFVIPKTFQQIKDDPEKYGYTVVTSKNQHIFPHMKEGTIVFLDSAHQLYTKLIPEGINTKVISQKLDNKLFTKQEHKRVETYVIHKEYLLSHFRKGRRNEIGKNGGVSLIKKWESKVNQYLQNKYEITLRSFF